MFRLVSIELRKIFHKRSVYVIFGLMVFFCLFNNVLYYLDYNEEGFYKYAASLDLNVEIEKLETELSHYDVSKTTDSSMWLSLKSKIDILNLKKSFSSNSWQYNFIDDYFYDIFWKRNMYTYLLFDEDELQKIEAEYQLIHEKLVQGDWQYFIQLSIIKKKEEIESLTLQLEQVTDVLEKKNIENELKNEQDELKILEYRIHHQIQEGQNYLNVALEELGVNRRILEEMEQKNKLSLEEEIQYQEAFSLVKVDEYILKNRVNILKENTVNYQLRTISEDYELFLVLLILILSSTIICEEFQKGTIKLLLIKPYSRGKILLSKYYACFLVLIISFIFLILIQLGIGVFLFGADSLKLPVVVYHFGRHELIEYSIWSYMLIRLVARLPFFILLLSMSFALSVFFTSGVVSLAIPMLVYLFDSTIRNLMIQYHLKFLYYLINIHWHFEDYLFGRKVEFEGITLKVSMIIWASYFLLLFILTFHHFQRKNIRNI